VAYKFDFAEAHNNLGVANRKLGQISSAAKNFEKAIKINKNYTLAHLNLGVTLAELGQKDEAVKCFKQAISIEPDNPLAHEKLKELNSD
jgi:tetratricopeptide (TPR) repeat protein